MIDEEYASKLIEKALTTGQTGVMWGIDDWPHVTIAIIAACMDFIPIIGPAVASFTILLGLIIFPLAKPANDPWDGLKTRVDILVNAKISDYHIESLHAAVQGLEANMEALDSITKSYEKAETSEKAKQAEILRLHHTSFLAVIRQYMPTFQIKDYRVQSLAMFGYVATLHLTLLSDGIKHGLEWGYPESYINDTLRPEFDGLTGSGTAGHVSGSGNLLTRTSEKDLDILQDAIEHGQALGWSPPLLDTWRAAHSSLILNPRGLYGRNLDHPPSDYPSYAKKTYSEGRKQVQPYHLNDGNYGMGTAEASKCRALADFDSFFITGVLSFAELWPYMSGDRKAPVEIEKTLDREIFLGPYGRYTGNVPWTNSMPPPIKPRGENITAVRMRTGDDMVGFQVKYGDTWGAYFGSEADGKEFHVSVPNRQSLEKVGVIWGHKIGQLTFASQPIGPARHADISTQVRVPGYAVSSAYITHYESWPPPGCEGIIFGFRPLLFV